MARYSKASEHNRMKTFSRDWNASKKARKQRKYRANLPLHLRSKLTHVHLSEELRKAHKTRNMAARVGDKVKIMRGQFKGREGTIEKVDRTYERIFVTGMEMIKKDGTKVLAPFHPSNLMLTELNLEDKRRIEVKK